MGALGHSDHGFEAPHDHFSDPSREDEDVRCRCSFVLRCQTGKDFRFKIFRSYVMVNLELVK